ncbi:MAG TPA: trehalose-6-phosphate synthase [Vicinamibacterales bacterium]|nr:trehalose-6-phosphate synthase [Vicinamibacterales bacterium]
MADVRERVIVLANRAPFRHESSRGRVVTTRSASGLVTALEPLLEAYAGTWVAHAAGSADATIVDAFGRIDVPPATPRYRVRYVSLPDDEYRGYYFGFANEGLWPLCHNVGVTPVFRRADYEMYRAANTRFAGVVADEAGGGEPIVLVQDYHFALAPRILRHQLPHGRVVAFWHIPWPRPRTLRTCPWALELLDGLLGSDIVGLQTDDDCRNFLGSVEALLDAEVDLSERTVTYRGRVTAVRAYPVGVDCAHDAASALPPAAACHEAVCREFGLPAGVRLGAGIDRMDYTKGINEKFLAIERLLESQPELVGRFAFIQVAEPSRDCLAAYRAARTQVIETCERVNARFATDAVLPIRLLERHHEPAEVYRYYRAADFCYVASLHDGMNLVAKEFVAARSDERGVLVLSQFAGAAQQLRAALLVNPLRIEQTAATLGQALEMPPIEQAKRMQILRANVLSFDASWWATQMVEAARPARVRSCAVA